MPVSPITPSVEPPLCPNLDLQRMTPHSRHWHHLDHLLPPILGVFTVQPPIYGGRRALPKNNERQRFDAVVQTQQPSSLRQIYSNKKLLRTASCLPVEFGFSLFFKTYDASN